MLNNMIECNDVKIVFLKVVSIINWMVGIYNLSIQLPAVIKCYETYIASPDNSFRSLGFDESGKPACATAVIK